MTDPRADRPGYAAIPHSLIRSIGELGISRGEWAVVSVLFSYANADDQAWPSIGTIARHLGMGTTQVRIHLDSLCRRELITRTVRPGLRTVYGLEPLRKAVGVATPTETRRGPQRETGPLRKTVGVATPTETRRGSEVTPTETRRGPQRFSVADQLHDQQYLPTGRPDEPLAQEIEDAIRDAAAVLCRMEGWIAGPEGTPESVRGAVRSLLAEGRKVTPWGIRQAAEAFAVKGSSPGMKAFAGFLARGAGDDPPPQLAEPGAAVLPPGHTPGMRNAEVAAMVERRRKAKEIGTET